MSPGEREGFWTALGARDRCLEGAEKEFHEPQARKVGIHDDDVHNLNLPPQIINQWVVLTRS